MTDVDAVLFDLDDTLVEYERDPGAVLAVAFERADVDPFFDETDYYAVYDDFLDESDGIDDLRERAFAHVARERGRDPEHGRAVARAFTRERDHTRVRVLPGARETLDALGERYPLGLVTNGDPGMQRAKLRGGGLADYFDAVVHGGTDAPAKPEPDCFRVALDALDATPDRAVHVGNSLTTDVPGAHAAGLRSVWAPATHDDPDPVPDYACETLRDVAAEPWRA